MAIKDMLGVACLLLTFAAHLAIPVHLKKPSGPRAIARQTNTGTVSKATLGKLRRHKVDRIWAFPSAQIPSLTERNSWSRHSGAEADSGNWCSQALHLSLRIFLRHSWHALPPSIPVVSVVWYYWEEIFLELFSRTCAIQINGSCTVHIPEFSFIYFSSSVRLFGS